MKLDTARTIVDEAQRLARAEGMKPLAIAVLDARGALKAMIAEDGTSLHRADVAIGKAYGGIALGQSSRRIMDRALKDPHFIAAVSHVVGGRLVLGAICAYLLFGMAFAFVYHAMWDLDPSVFGGDLGESPLFGLLYFSYVTLATLFAGSFGRNLDTGTPADKMRLSPEVAALDAAVRAAPAANLGLPSRAYNEFRAQEDYAMRLAPADAHRRRRALHALARPEFPGQRDRHHFAGRSPADA